MKTKRAEEGDEEEKQKGTASESGVGYQASQKGKGPRVGRLSRDPA